MGEHVGPTQSIVLRHPDHVGRAEPGLGILHHDGESCRSRPSPQRPHVRDAAASERDGGANCEPDYPNRSDGATGAQGAPNLQIPLGSTRFIS